MKYRAIRDRSSQWERSFGTLPDLLRRAFSREKISWRSCNRAICLYAKISSKRQSKVVKKLSNIAYLQLFEGRCVETQTLISFHNSRVLRMRNSSRIRCRSKHCGRAIIFDCDSWCLTSMIRIRHYQCYWWPISHWLEIQSGARSAYWGNSIAASASEKNNLREYSSRQSVRHFIWRSCIRQIRALQSKRM